MIWKWLLTMTFTFIGTWLIAGVFILFKPKNKHTRWISIVFPVLGNIATLLFLALLWIELERPPMRTMAETRLWYSLFVAWITWSIYLKTRSAHMYLLGFIMASVFLIVDIIHPEYQSKTLMPALQSPWFIPHVVIYMISYAVLAAACLSALIGMYSLHKKRSSLEKEISLAMKLVYPGMGLLTLGMLMGAIWAKIAWGNYWTYDPKETWALLTWLFYLITIHLHYAHSDKKRLLLWILALSFIVLIITWMGIRYLPSGMQSIHVYG